MQLPIPPTSPLREHRKRRVPSYHNYPEHFDFDIAFANRIKHLVLEVAFDLLHPDILREELYFSENHIRITRIVYEAGLTIENFFTNHNQNRWQYTRENVLKTTLNHVFPLI